MRSAALLVASMLIVACSGSDGPGSADTSQGSASTIPDSSDVETVDSTDAAPDSVPAAPTGTTSRRTTSTSTTSTSTTTTTTTVRQRTGGTTTTAQTPIVPTTAAVNRRTPLNTVAPIEPVTPTTSTAGSTTSVPAPGTANVPDATVALGAFRAAVAGFSVENDFIELVECPLDPSGALLAGTFGGISDPGLASAVGGLTDHGIFDLGGGYGPIVSCDFFADAAPHGVGLYAFAAPSDMTAYAESFGNPDEVEGVEVLVETTGTLGDGVFHHLCVFDEVEPEFDFCEVNWVADGVLIGVYIEGPAVSGVDRNALEAGFASQLTAIVDAFAG